MLSVALSFLVAFAPGAADDGTVALLPAVSDGLTSDVVARAERLLRAAFDRSVGTAAQKEALTRARLEAGETRGLGCDRAAAFSRPLQAPCLVAAGVVVEADQTVSARLTPAGPGIIRLELLSFDVVAGSAIRRVMRRGPLNESLVNDAVARLADDELAGAILVVEPPPGARVLLDDVPRDVSDGRVALDAGAHRIAFIQGDRQRTWNVDLESGTAADVGAASGGEDLPAPPAAVQASAGEPDAGAGSLDLVTGAPILASAAVGVVGLALVVVGLAPRVGYALDAGALRTLDDEVRQDPAVARDKAAEIQTTRAHLDENAAAWTGWGIPLVVTGAAIGALGAGAAAAFAAAPVLDAMLRSPDEATP